MLPTLDCVHRCHRPNACLRIGETIRAHHNREPSGDKYQKDLHEFDVAVYEQGAPFWSRRQFEDLIAQLFSYREPLLLEVQFAFGAGAQLHPDIRKQRVEARANYRQEFKSSIIGDVPGDCSKMKNGKT